jgi:hypothetical protein
MRHPLAQQSQRKIKPALSPVGVNAVVESILHF